MAGIGRETMIWYINEFALWLAFCALFALVIEVGFRLGRNSKDRENPDIRAHVVALQSAALVLLALLLGFTFAMSISRFDARHNLLVTEVNATKAAFLRSQYLPQPQHQEVVALLKEYVSARTDFYVAATQDARFRELSAITSRIEERLWTIATEASSTDARARPLQLFAESVNDMVDSSEKRRAALDNHVPEAVIFLLLSVSGVALGFVSYGCGLAGHRRLVMNTIFAVLIATFITIILDIDRPRRGLIQVDHSSILRLKEMLDRNP